MTDQKEPIFEEEPPAPIEADPKVARRKRLLANLEKGRKTALENRKKKAMYKKLKRQEEVDEMDKAIVALESAARMNTILLLVCSK